jgi:hypothetical protein
VGSDGFPFQLNFETDSLVNGDPSNLVEIGLIPYGGPTGDIWVNVAFFDGEQFAGTPPSITWTCSSLTDGLPAGATGGIACQYTGSSTDSPDDLVYILGVDVAEGVRQVTLQYCGTSRPGAFTDPGCEPGKVQMSVTS